MRAILLLALLDPETQRRAAEPELLGERRPQVAPVVVVEPGRGVHEQRERGRALPGLRHVVDLRRLAERVARDLAPLLHLREPLVQFARRDLARVLGDAL